MGEVIEFRAKLARYPARIYDSPFSVRVTWHDGLWYVTTRKNGGWCYSSYREAVREAGELAAGYDVGSVIRIGAMQ